MYEVNFAAPLLIGAADALHSVIVQFLKNQGWIVHGMDRVEVAVWILPQVPPARLVPMVRGKKISGHLWFTFIPRTTSTGHEARLRSFSASLPSIKRVYQ